MVEVAETNTYISDFAAFVEKNTLGGPSWLPAKRQEAMDRFADLGFPTTRHEEWLYTNVAPIQKADLSLATSYASHGFTEEKVRELTFDIGDAHTIVFVNGIFSPELSDLGKLPKGATVDSLAASLGSEGAIADHLTKYAKFDDHAFVALNTAYLRDGLFLHLAKGAVVEKPIHLVYLGAAPEGGIACHPRNLLIAEANSQATVVESHAGNDGQVYFTNEVTEAYLAENAHFSHYKVNRSGDASFHVSTFQVHQERSSVLYSQNLCFGGALVRNDINTYLDGEGVDSTFDGLFLIKGDQHVDNHTKVDHAKPHCESHELYKGILDDKATSCFNGKIFVHEDAQKTDAFQSNMNLLLSDTAQAATKPQLEIFADDVKCSHGATIGQLDKEALFYLRARGIAEPMAKSLLTYAFANDVVQRIKLDTLREQLDDFLYNQLPQAS